MKKCKTFGLAAFTFVWLFVYASFAQIAFSQQNSDQAAQEGRGGTALWRVVDCLNDKPVLDASVVIEQVLNEGYVDLTQQEILKRDNQTTGVGGSIELSFSPAEVAESNRLVILNVAHPQYTTRRVLTAMRRIAAAVEAGKSFDGDPIRLYPAKEIHGTVLDSQGSPARNVKIRGFTYPGDRQYRPRTSETRLTFFEEVTDAEGRFRINVASSGHGAFWLFPDQDAPLGIVISPEQENLGVIQLAPGLQAKGRLIDAAGKPVGGIRVTAIRKSAESAAMSQFLRDARQSTKYSRVEITDDEGWFTLQPLALGDYLFQLEPAYFSEPKHAFEGVFAFPVRQISAAHQELEFRALPASAIVVRTFDSQGLPTKGILFNVAARIGQDVFSTIGHRANIGQTTAQIPQDSREIRMAFVYGQDDVALVRQGTDRQPEVNVREISLEPTKASLEGIEITRYRAASLLISAVDSQGNAIVDFETVASAEHPELKPGSLKVNFEKLQDGTMRAVGLLPGSRVTVLLKKQGWTTKEQHFNIKEGETGEATFTMAPN